MKKLLKLMFQRVFLVGLAIFTQIALVVLFIFNFEGQFVYFYALSTLLSIFVVLYIINGRSNPGYKIAWIIPILLVPIFGGLFYLMFGGNRVSNREKRKMFAIGEQLAALLPAESAEMVALAVSDPDAAIQARYIYQYAFAPVYSNTYTRYLPTGEDFFACLKEELRKAEHYIFMEYFILKEGKMWDEILEIMAEKAKQGVDVRLLYDDMGCIMTLPYRYEKQVEALGIRCAVFNPFKPVISSRFNNRDHRKITVVDGHVGFTGGINLSDEYINAYSKHGHWKDSAVLLKGDAVWNLSVMFLSMWDYLCGGETENLEAYRPRLYAPPYTGEPGYVQPFCDSPVDEESVGETVYMNLITKARDYVYITSPYLIIDNEMVTALCNAAKSGVDVRIITPHVADKWYVHAVTRAYYDVLVECGVSIYEYTPGFIHAKTYAVDDQYAVVGTINMDYRSLYLHFECAAWMYRTPAVMQVKEDFLKTLEECERVTLEHCRSVKWPTRVCRAVLRVFAPLM